MALPSVMVKVVCSVRGGSRRVADRTERTPRCAVGVVCCSARMCMGGHVAFKRESPRRDIASCATTPNHMIASAASSTQVRGMRRHVIPRCGCTIPRTHDTAGTALWLNRDPVRQKNRPRPHSLEGLWGTAWVQSGGCFHLSAHISQGERHHHQD